METQDGSTVRIAKDVEVQPPLGICWLDFCGRKGICTHSLCLAQAYSLARTARFQDAVMTVLFLQ